MQSPQFPVGCAAIWQNATTATQLTAQQRNWLLETGSLTKKLQQHCNQFAVQVLGQQQLPLHNTERSVFPDNNEALIREVLLLCDNVPWVFARSILPESLLERVPTLTTDLGSNSLGERLFQHNKLQRQQFEIATFNSTSSVARLSSALGYPSTISLWGRRSRFVIQQQSLLVQEVFLPACSLYRDKDA